jgi:hypothetical protein
MYHSIVIEFLVPLSETNELYADLFNLSFVSCFSNETSPGKNGLSSGLQMFCAAYSIISTSFLWKVLVQK